MFARQNTSSLLKQVCGLLGCFFFCCCWLVGLGFFYTSPNLVILQNVYSVTVVLMKMSFKCCLLLVLTEYLFLIFLLFFGTTYLKIDYK